MQNNTVEILDYVYEVKDCLLEGWDKESCIQKIVSEFRLNELQEEEIRDYFKKHGVV